MIGYLDDVIRPLVLILSKISEYAKTFNNKKNNLMSFRLHDYKLLQKYKAIWVKIEDLKTIELNVLLNGLNLTEDGVECKSFTTISTDSFLVYENKYYPQVYFDNCAYKIENTQMID